MADDSSQALGTDVSAATASDRATGEHSDQSAVRMFGVSAETPLGGSSAPTLVVCPMSVLAQWRSEVLRHCKNRSVTCLMHYGSNRHSSSDTLRRCDICVTTYGADSRFLDQSAPAPRPSD